MMYPSEVKIIVYAARNLQPKKKGGVCVASVVFGVGKEKYRTEIVKGDNPTWNEEGTINISNPNGSLVLTVLDKEEAIGNITLPLNSLPSAAHKRQWLPLQRKHQTTTSDLCFDCWITQFKKEKAWSKFNPFFTSSQSPREKRRDSIASASTGIRGSTSTIDLCSKGLEEERYLSVEPLSTKAVSSSDVSVPPPPGDLPLVVSTNLPKPNILSQSIGAVMSMKGPPQITGISPRFGPSCGGTKITIRGCNLGCNADDFIGFSICSIDHLEALEYHSPAKLICTTASWDGKKSNCGPIIIVTKSSGRGISTVMFEFQGDPVVTKKKDGSNRKGTKKSKNETTTELNDEKRIKALETENKCLRNYIDNLMVLLMEKYPDVLEIKAGK